MREIRTSGTTIYVRNNPTVSSDSWYTTENFQGQTRIDPVLHLKQNCRGPIAMLELDRRHGSVCIYPALVHRDKQTKAHGSPYISSSR